MMKQILAGSVLWRFLCAVHAWYNQGAIARFFGAFKEAYPNSKTQAMWKKFISAPLFPNPSCIYPRLHVAFRRWLRKAGQYARNSVIYRVFAKIAAPVGNFLGGGIVGRVCRFFGFRGLLLLAVALYLPIDYFLRSSLFLSVAGPLSFLSSAWDEGLLILCFLYICWRSAMRKDPLGTRMNPVELYILMFIAVSIFLMCAVSPYFKIAMHGLRAVVQYLLWFFLVIRLIEDDHDFAIFYGTIVALGVLLGLHGIYQYIVAVPIPAGWVSATEESVRTRVFSITGSPNIMGSILVLFAPMVAGIAYFAKKFWVKALAICGTGIMCLSILFTFSKGAWGGLAVAVLLFAIFLDRRLIALMAVGGAGALACIPSIASRITYLFTADYMEASQRAGRMVRWETGFNLLAESNKLLGFGLGRFGGAVAMQYQILEVTDDFEYFYMDNYYLKTLVEMGYLGLIFFIIMLIGMAVWCLRAVGRSKQNRTFPLAAAMFSGMVGVLVHCYFENIFEVPYMMAYFWSLAACILYLGYYRKSKKIE